MTMTITVPASTQTPFGPIGRDVYARTYSRPLGSGNEEWPDSVRRVVRGNTQMDGAGYCLDGGRLTELMDDFRLLPAGRHLWVTGVDGIPAEARRNCWRAPFTSRLADHFEFVGSMLLLGGGVGANYSSEYLALAPAVRPFGMRITCDPSHPDASLVMKAAEWSWTASPYDTIRVEDSREGWVAAWGALFDASVRGIDVGFDLSDVRPAGEPIKTFGGTASGPGPLASSLYNAVIALSKAVGRRLSPLEAMECDHALASAVVAGGARRSARMSILRWNDPYIFDFLACKADPSQHWTTNISVEVDDEFFAALDTPSGNVVLDTSNPHDRAVAVLQKVIDGMILNGEPGLYNSSLASVGEYGDVRATNPCGEVPLQPGESCNIGSVNLDAIGDDQELAEEGFRLMTRFLIRQTLTPMRPGLSADIEGTNRRIGAGFLGLQGWAAAHGVRYSDIPKSALLRAKLRRFREVCRQEADAYAAELGIPSPVKVTAVAPNGTIAQLCGTQPGAHPILMRHGIRNVRYTSGDPRIDEARGRGLVVEACIYAENTWVVGYPMEDPLMARFPADLIEDISQISVEDQLAVLACVTEEFCSGDDGNGVSFTASFDPETVDWKALYDTVSENIRRCKGITCFPTASRPQSPYVPISEAAYLSLTDNGARDTGDTGEEDLTGCAGGACPIR